MKLRLNEADINKIAYLVHLPVLSGLDCQDSRRPFLGCWTNNSTCATNWTIIDVFSEDQGPHIPCGGSTLVLSGVYNPDLGPGSSTELIPALDVPPKSD